MKPYKSLQELVNAAFNDVSFNNVHTAYNVKTYSDEAGYTVEVDLAGVKKENCEVTATKNAYRGINISVKAKRVGNTNAEYSIPITLQRGDIDTLTAKLEDGVLTITVAHEPVKETKSKVVKVQ